MQYSLAVPKNDNIVENCLLFNNIQVRIWQKKLAISDQDYTWNFQTKK